MWGRRRGGWGGYRGGWGGGYGGGWGYRGPGWGWGGWSSRHRWGIPLFYGPRYGYGCFGCLLPVVMVVAALFGMIGLRKPPSR